MLTVDAAGVRIWPYWQPEQVQPLPPDSDAGYVEQLVDLFQRAVACRMRSAYPVGAHLSGGLDSSGVTALAARQARQRGLPCTAFSWSPPVEGMLENDDERALVDAVQVTEGIACHYAPGTMYDVAATRLRPLDLPERRFFPESQVRRLAQAEGIRVMLSGWGGDELAAFNGRGYLADLWRRGHWRTLWRESRAYGQLRGYRTAQVLRGKGILPHIPDRFLPFTTWSVWPMPREHQDTLTVPPLLHPDIAAQLAEADPGPPEQMRRERPGVRRNQLDLLAHGHLTTRAEWWATEAPEAGLDYRYPMLDRRLVEFSLGLPPQLYVRGGWGRYILRQALEGIVPPRVQWNKSKEETRRNVYRQTLERTWRRQLLRPLAAEVLSDYEHFHSIDVPRLREMLHRKLSNPEGRALPTGFPQLLRVELMMNRPLAMDIHAWLYERQQRYDNASQGEAAHLSTRENT